MTYTKTADKTSIEIYKLEEVRTLLASGWIIKKGSGGIPNLIGYCRGQVEANLTFNSDFIEGYISIGYKDSQEEIITLRSDEDVSKFVRRVILLGMCKEFSS